MSTSPFGSVSGVAFVDSNGRGAFQSQDFLVPGVNLTLTGTTTTGSAVSANAQTDGQGAYSVHERPPRLVPDHLPLAGRTSRATPPRATPTAPAGPIRRRVHRRLATIRHREHRFRRPRRPVHHAEHVPEHQYVARLLPRALGGLRHGDQRLDVHPPSSSSPSPHQRRRERQQRHRSRRLLRCPVVPEHHRPVQHLQRLVLRRVVRQGRRRSRRRTSSPTSNPARTPTRSSTARPAARSSRAAASRWARIRPTVRHQGDRHALPGHRHERVQRDHPPAYGRDARPGARRRIRGRISGSSTWRTTPPPSTRELHGLRPARRRLRATRSPTRRSSTPSPPPRRSMRVR